VPTSAPRKRSHKAGRPLRLAGVVCGLAQPGAVTLGGPRIERVMYGARSAAETGDHILPGFIDLQVNGAYGIDVMSATADDLLRLSHRLAHEGVTGWLPTVITSPLETIERCDAVIGAAMAAQREIDQLDGRAPAGAAILGMHLEGPFIAPNRLGAHPALNLLPRGESLERALRLKSLRLITLAPELEGALEAIARFTTAGVAVSLGHSDATFAQANAGVAAGARMFTHLFNAMRPWLHREPGIAGAALEYGCAARAAIIPDGVHIHPAAARMAYRARGPEGMIFATDRIALAGADSDTSMIFGEDGAAVAIREGAARTAGGTLAGSVATMLDGAWMFFGDDDFKRWHALPCVTALNPAATLHLDDRGLIGSGARADLIILDRELKLKAVFIGGREID
jgi:N-acetylglucosamine-6-phosphate deacetylase